MQVYAEIWVDSLDPAKVAQAGDQLRWLDELRAQQPGSLGAIIVDLGGGRQVLVDLWESEEHHRAGLAVLGPWASQLLLPLMTQPSQLVGAGPAATTGGLRWGCAG